MGPHRAPGPAGGGVHDDVTPARWLVLVPVAAAVLVYLAAVLRLRSRGTGWPLSRSLSWVCGWGCVGVALAGPLAARAHHDFAVHMVTHVAMGMLAPLLLVSAAPFTLVLRALPVREARPLARALASRPVAVVAHPLTAALLDLGGLWLLYRTGLYHATMTDPWVHLAVSVHVVAAGYLFTAAVLGGPDPAPHRAPIAWRVGVLVAALAAHNVLAKVLYAHPPPGVPVEQAEQASQWMYYGGMLVEIPLLVLLCRSWLATGPRAGGDPAAAGTHRVDGRQQQADREQDQPAQPHVGLDLGEQQHA